MRRQKRRAWSPEERVVLDRFVQAIKDGEYDAIAKAARACLQELGTARAYDGVYCFLGRNTRSARRGSLNSFWTPEEKAFVVRFVRALVAGRYRTAPEAAEACEKAMTKLWRRRAGNTRPAVPRNRQAILIRILNCAKGSGRVSVRAHWSRAELRVLDRYASDLAHNRYRDAHLAAAALHADLGRLRPRPPTRTRLGVCARLEARARELGWSWAGFRMLPRERRLLEAYAARAARDRSVNLNELARECHSRIMVVYDHFRARRPAGEDGYSRPSRKSVGRYIAKRARLLGRHMMDDWRPDEDAAIDRFALALLDGEYDNADAAALSCQRELARERKRWRTTDPNRYKRTLARTLEAVHTRLCELAHTHRRSWPKAAWSKDEMRVLRAWIPWYRRHRSTRGFAAMKTTAEGIQEELERLGCRRSVPACYGRFAKEWHQLLRQAV